MRTAWELIWPPPVSLLLALLLKVSSFPLLSKLLQLHVRQGAIISIDISRIWNVASAGQIGHSYWSFQPESCSDSARVCAPN